MMKAVVYHKKSSSDRLHYRDIARPIPKSNEVLVRVQAVSLNAADYRMMKLGMIPKGRIFGSAISGTVESTGSSAHQFQQGDGVIGDLADFGFGGLAEYAAAPENTFTEKPEKVSFVDAAALPVAATTALKALREKGQIQAGQSVLIVGSSGGVGTFALQLAKYFGAEVTAVCSTRNIGQSISLGADLVIDYTKEDFTKSVRRFDLILAINGSYSLMKLRRLLKNNGIYVMVGGSFSQVFKSLILGPLMSFGGKKMRSLSAKSDPVALAFVAKLVQDGQLRPVIEHHFTLEETARAMNHISQGHAKGKVVIKI